MTPTADDVGIVVDRLKRLDMDVHKMFSRKVFREIEASLSATADQHSAPVIPRKAACSVHLDSQVIQANRVAETTSSSVS